MKRFILVGFQLFVAAAGFLYLTVGCTTEVRSQMNDRPILSTGIFYSYQGDSGNFRYNRFRV